VCTDVDASLESRAGKSVTMAFSGDLKQSKAARGQSIGQYHKIRQLMIFELIEYATKASQGEL
jgi:hypothetical protein